MEEIKKGSLVRLHRRRKQGMGIVIKQINDVAKILKIDDGRQITATCRDLAWHERTPFIESISKLSGEYDLCSNFFYYNAKWCKKYKNEFSLVRWFKNPSIYTSSESQQTSWYPTEWLKTVKNDVDDAN